MMTENTRLLTGGQDERCHFRWLLSDHAEFLIEGGNNECHAGSIPLGAQGSTRR